MGKNSRSWGSRGRSCAGYIGDRKLVPRIKEYIKENDGIPLEADEVATALQAEYSEYSRKKKTAFRNSVAKALSLVVSGGVSSGEEGKLWRLERRHLDARQRREEEEEEESREGSGEEIGGQGSDDSCDFEEEICDDLNMMNNSLLQVYRDNTTAATPSTWNQDATTSVSESHSYSDGDVLRDGTESVTVSRSHSAGGSVFVGTNGTPAAIIDTSSDSHVTVDVTTSDSHVTVGADHMTTPEGHVMKTQNLVSPVVSTAELLCSGDSVRVGKGDVGRGTDCEERRRLKKVTFAPDVVDKQTTTVLKSPRKRRHVPLGDEDGTTSSSGHKKHRTHREHKTHHSKLGRLGKGEGEEGKVVASIKQEKPQFKVESSSVTFADIGGCQAAIKEVSKLLLHVRHPDIFTRLGIHPPQGFLLHGPPGCGKTLLACAIAGELGLPLIRLAATEIVSGVSGESESTLRDLFTLAKGSVPCVLFIDEVDVICPKRDMAQREMEKRIVSQLLACVDDLYSSAEGSRVLLIAATTQPDSLDPAVRRSGRFDREICLGIPDEAARLSILQVMTRGLCLEADFPYSDLAHRTPGYVGADLKALIREASLCAVNRLLASNSHTHFTTGSGASIDSSQEGAPPSDPTENLVPSTPQEGTLNETGCVEDLEDMYIIVQDFELALQEVQPSAKREGFATVPDTSWEDVGALEDVREELSLAILAPVRFPQQFASLGLTTPPGILLAGPPGCGKTLLAKAVANESGINFISVKGPELLNMYVGESERAVRQVFQRARNSAPCVIFFDELDALCPRRSEMAEASARVVNQLLTEMDGLQTRRQVFIMAATNRPDIVDPAVLRPGRLDKLVYVGLPCTRDRAIILNTITKNGTRPRLDQTVDIATLASPTHTEGFSGADLKALVREAAIAALKDYMQLQSSHWVSPDHQSDCTTSLLPSAMERAKVDVSECTLAMHHFLSALDRVTPSVSEKDRHFYDRMREQFGKSARKK